MNIDKLIAGLEIMKPHCDSIGGADHDVIFGAPEDTSFTDEEKVSLVELGWRLSDEYGCWVCFV